MLKTPLTDDPALSGRLRDEGKVGLLVKHPHLVETIESFDHGGRPVVVVEFIRGVSVGELRKTGALGVAAVARIGRQIASALQAMHTARDSDGRALGIVHRDVSAGNILIDTKGDAMLIDLGIAKFDGTRAAVTNTGDVIGTLRYLAPELLDATSGSAKSDIWSLGCVLAEAASGTPVFEGKTAEVLASIIRFTHYEGTGIDARLATVLRSMLTKDAKARATAADVIKLLTELEASSGGGAADLADLATASLNHTQRSRSRAELTAPTAEPAALVAPVPARRSALPTLAVGVLLATAGYAAGSINVAAADDDGVVVVARAKPKHRAGPDVLPAIVNVFSDDADCVAEAVAWKRLRETAKVPAAPIINYPNGMRDAAVFASTYHLGSNVMTVEVYDRLKAPPPVNHFTTMIVDRDGVVRWWGFPHDPEFADALRTGWATIAEEDRLADAKPGEATAQAAEDEFKRAGLALLGGDAAGAAAMLRPLVEQRPDDARIHRSYAISLAKLRRNDEARVHYRRYLELAPNADDADLVRTLLQSK